MLFSYCLFYSVRLLTNELYKFMFKWNSSLSSSLYWLVSIYYTHKRLYIFLSVLFRTLFLYTKVWFNLKKNIYIYQKITHINLNCIWIVLFLERCPCCRSLKHSPSEVRRNCQRNFKPSNFAIVSIVYATL